jgi:hypothetical protein
MQKQSGENMAMHQLPTLETLRLTLRPFHATDAPAGGYLLF